MFGARRDDNGVWRLCEKRGRLIVHVSPTDRSEIAFPDRAHAEECADELNDKYWESYRRDRRMTQGLEIQRGILAVVVAHGGLSEEAFREMYPV